VFASVQEHASVVTCASELSNMTTIPHILTGAAVASLLPTGSTSMKVLGFALGMASHYVLDAIPHWERLYGAHYNDELPESYAKWPKHITTQALAEGFIGCAALFAILVIAMPGPSKTVVFLGALGAVLPDLMDSIPPWSERTRGFPIWHYLRRLHDWSHLDYDLQRKLPSSMGLISQIAVIITALLVLLRG